MVNLQKRNTVYCDEHANLSVECVSSGWDFVAKNWVNILVEAGFTGHHWKMEYLEVKSKNLDTVSWRQTLFLLDKEYAVILECEPRNSEGFNTYVLEIVSDSSAAKIEFDYLPPDEEIISFLRIAFRNNYFRVYEIEFDFDDGDEFDLSDEERKSVVSEVVNRKWYPEDEEGLPDLISDQVGWCIKSLKYDRVG